MDYVDRIEKLKERFSEEDDKEWTDEEIIQACVAVVYNGVFKKRWNVNITSGKKIKVKNDKKEFNYD